MGSSRVTIMLDEGNEKYLRTKQANLIKKTNEGWSFSKVLNQELGHSKSS